MNIVDESMLNVRLLPPCTPDISPGVSQYVNIAVGATFEHTIG